MDRSLPAVTVVLQGEDSKAKAPTRRTALVCLRPRPEACEVGADSGPSAEV